MLITFLKKFLFSTRHRPSDTPPPSPGLDQGCSSEGAAACETRTSESREKEMWKPPSCHRRSPSSRC